MQEILEAKSLIDDVESKVLPAGHELLPGLNSIYELELALAETRVLSKDELIRRGAYFARIDGIETHHFRLCSTPLLVNKNSFRLRAFFEVFRYKTSYATHGLFPYRGKFHPQLIKAIMNIIGLKPGDLVLDPMTGSGTTNVESSLIGMNSIGFDLNPFAVFMSKTKIDALYLKEDEIERLRSEATPVLTAISSGNVQETLIEHEKDRVESKVHPVLLLCYLDALGYSRRVKTKKLPELFPTVLERYISAIRNFALARDELGLSLSQARVEQLDSRNMKTIESESIDGIVTSPPYSFAIDYLKSDSLQLQFLGYDLKALRENMIGLRGKDLKEQVSKYLEDMEMTIAEMSRVLKQDHYAVMIVGTNSVQLEKIENATGLRLEDELVKLAKKHELTLVQRFERPIEGVQNLMKSEHILFLRKMG